MNALWVVWIVMFIVLETMGLLGIGGMKPLTYFLRSAVPQFGSLMLAGLVWIAAHVFLEEKWRKRKDTE